MSGDACHQDVAASRSRCPPYPNLYPGCCEDSASPLAISAAQCTATIDASSEARLQHGADVLRAASCELESPETSADAAEALASVFGGPDTPDNQYGRSLATPGGSSSARAPSNKAACCAATGGLRRNDGGPARDPDLEDTQQPLQQQGPHSACSATGSGAGWPVPPVAGTARALSCEMLQCVPALPAHRDVGAAAAAWPTGCQSAERESAAIDVGFVGVLVSQLRESQARVEALQAQLADCGAARQPLTAQQQQPQHQLQQQPQQQEQLHQSRCAAQAAPQQEEQQQDSDAPPRAPSAAAAAGSHAGAGVHTPQPLQHRSMWHSDRHDPSLAPSPLLNPHAAAAISSGDDPYSSGDDCAAKTRSSLHSTPQQLACRLALPAFAAPPGASGTHRLSRRWHQRSGRHRQPRQAPQPAASPPLPAAVPTLVLPQRLRLSPSPSLSQAQPRPQLSGASHRRPAPAAAAFHGRDGAWAAHTATGHSGERSGRQQLARARARTDAAHRALLAMSRQAAHLSARLQHAAQQAAAYREELLDWRAIALAHHKQLSRLRAQVAQLQLAAAGAQQAGA